jgi:hypothetical protein
MSSYGTSRQQAALRRARATVRVTRIPSSGEAPVRSLVCRLPGAVTVRRGTATVTLRGLRLHGAAVVEVYAPPKVAGSQSG